ncbi:hypothetical protein KPL47_15805 [Clostridium estertheticum]|uniref:hypothetical protein n=1 Tax=Clostridium estertheticum TaxID=238834 RepID=UPI001C0BE123|nr:hypothetical protein [Clostridium estertheticum]MBU3177796.1 hypothetical protein [Clostridium estertheticum]
MRYKGDVLLVQEVIDYIKHSRLFERLQSLNNYVKIINDYDKAQEIAWTQNLNVVETLWEYVKSSETSEIIGKVYEKNLLSSDYELKDIFDANENYSDDFIPSGYLDIIEEVQGDLYMCALNRLVNGKTDNFYENVFDVYKAGGWPCGWEGKYPNGKIIGYIPLRDS